MRSYYSKIQQRFVDRGEYFDELLFATLEPPFDKPITVGVALVVLFCKNSVAKGN